MTSVCNICASKLDKSQLCDDVCGGHQALDMAFHGTDRIITVGTSLSGGV